MWNIGAPIHMASRIPVNETALHVNFSPGTPPGSARLEAAPPASAIAPRACQLRLLLFEPREVTERWKSWAKGSSEILSTLKFAL